MPLNGKIRPNQLYIINVIVDPKDNYQNKKNIPGLEKIKSILFKSSTAYCLRPV